MRIAVILGKTHDGKVAVAEKPGDPAELNKRFKELSGEKENAKFSELYLHELSLSAGRKRATFAKPSKRE